MQISFHGLSCFLLKGKNASVATDPFDAKKTGIKLKKLTADIVTVSQENSDHLDANSVKAADGDPILVNWPGEYEYRQISIIGTAAWQNKKEATGGDMPTTIFTYLIDDIHICHLGMLGHSLTTEQVDDIGEVDILLVPVGGIGSFDVDKACETIDKIEPRVIIPMYYAHPDAKEKLGSLEAFLKKFGDSPEKTDLLKITRRDLPSEDQTRLIVLEAK